MCGTAATPTQPSSEDCPSTYHIQTTIPTLASLPFAQLCTALFAVLWSRSIIHLTAGSLPAAGELMLVVVRPLSRSIVILQHVGVPKARSSCSSFSVLVNEFTSPPENHGYLQYETAGAGVNPGFLINETRGVIGCVPMTYLACQLRRC
jgi:hypothetical protein